MSFLQLITRWNGEVASAAQQNEKDAQILAAHADRLATRARKRVANTGAKKPEKASKANPLKHKDAFGIIKAAYRERAQIIADACETNDFSSVFWRLCDRKRCTDPQCCAIWVTRTKNGGAISQNGHDRQCVVDEVSYRTGTVQGEDGRCYGAGPSGCGNPYCIAKIKGDHASVRRTHIEKQLPDLRDRLAVHQLLLEKVPGVDKSLVGSRITTLEALIAKIVAELPGQLKNQRAGGHSELKGFQQSHVGTRDQKLRCESCDGMPDAEEIALSERDTAPPSISESTTGLRDAAEPDSSESSHGLQLKPVDRGKDAWLFVASACTLEMVLWGYCYSYGTIQQYLTSHPPFSTSSSVATGATGTVALGLLFMSLLILFPLFQRYPEKIQIAVRTGLVVCVLSLLLSSFATRVWQLILLQGVLFGCGAGVLYAPAAIWLFEWFAARRGAATGIIFAGGGLGGAIFPIVLGKLLDTVGFANTMRIWSGFTALSCGIALVGLKPRLPLPPRSAPRAPLVPRDLSMFRSPLFWSVSGVVIMQGIGYLSVSLYISTFAVSLGYSPQLGQLSLSVFNTCALFGQLIMGALGDRAPFPIIMSISAILCALFAFLLGLASSIGLVLAFAALFALAGGGFSSVWPVASTHISKKNPQQAGLVFSLFGVGKGIASIAGPAIAGSLHDPNAVKITYGGRGFEKMIIFVGASMVASFLGALGTHIIRLRTKND